MTYKIAINITAIIFTFSVFGQNIRDLTPSEKEEISRLEEIGQLYLNEGDAQNAAYTYSKIAFSLWKMGRPHNAIDNFITAADLYLEANKLVEVKNIYSNLGVLHTDLEEFEFALEYFNKSLAVRRKLGKKTDIAAGLVDIAFIMQTLKYSDDAIEHLEEALAIATKEKNSQLIIDCYQLLSINYEQIGNIKKSNEFSAKAESYQSFIQEESLKADFTEEVAVIQQKAAQTEEEKRLAQQLFELRQKLYQQTEDSLSTTLRSKQDSLFLSAQQAKAKQAEIQLLEKEREFSNLKLKEQEAQQAKQRLIILTVVIGLALMIVLAIVMLRANRARKKANTKLEKNNKEIAEKSEQLGIALKKIAHQNQNITQSINYAKGIQRALLPKPEQLNDFIKDSFIFFKPRDIVSGDFYWFREIDAKSDIFKIFGMHRKKEEETIKKTDTKLIISAVDCTGHGVPGAFMSMIGYNLLDEITNKGISRPDLILEELHRGVRFTLKQRETNNQDGMDMAICVVDKEKKTVEYSGAKNPLIYIQNNEVQQIKGDKYGIGGKSDDHKFTSHLINVDKPTWFYMFSDGYIDQFGGDNGRKFMIKNFREYITSIHTLPMQEQHDLLDKKLADWMGTKYSQIDDVLVMGFKLDFN